MEGQVSSGLRVTLMVHFVFAIIFGLAYLLTPQSFGKLIGWTIEEPENIRVLGAAILGYGAGSWFAYKETAAAKVKIVVQMELVWTIIGTLAILWGLLSGAFPALGWLNAIIMAGFAIAFGIFYPRNLAS